MQSIAVMSRPRMQAATYDVGAGGHNDMSGYSLSARGTVLRRGDGADEIRKLIRTEVSGA
jgi:hypothetical protein